MDGKYNGCNVVESTVRAVPRGVKKDAGKSRRAKTYLVKLSIAATAVGIIAAVHFIPALEAVREVLHSIMCYDVFGRTAFGTSPMFA